MLGYTLAQFNAYLELSYRRERRQRREVLRDMHLAHIGGEHLQKLFDDLKD